MLNVELDDKDIEHSICFSFLLIWMSELVDKEDTENRKKRQQHTN